MAKHHTEKTEVRTFFLLFFFFFGNKKCITQPQVTFIISEAKTSYYSSQLFLFFIFFFLNKVVYVVWALEQENRSPTLFNYRVSLLLFSDFFLSKVFKILLYLANPGSFADSLNTASASEHLSPFEKHLCSLFFYLTDVKEVKPTSFLLGPFPISLLVEWIDPLVPTITNIINNLPSG